MHHTGVRSALGSPEGISAHAAVKLAPSALVESAPSAALMTDSSIEDRADLSESTSLVSIMMTSIVMRSARLCKCDKRDS